MRPAALIATGIVAFAIWRVYLNTKSNTNALDVITTQGALIGAIIMGTPASKMKLSQVGLDAIATREGFAATKYPDAMGYSIGYGHFIKPGEFFSEPMSREKARELLLADTGIAADAVRAYVTAPLTQNRFDALVSFVYNVGVGAFKKSTLLRKLNAGDVAGAAAEFDRWHIPTSVIARRDKEKAQFLA